MSKVQGNSPPSVGYDFDLKSPNSNNLIEQHLGLADSLANRFSRRGVDTDDLKQVAYLALVKAAKNYEPDRQVSFSAYATPTILGELKRYFRDSGWMVRPPRWVQNLQLEVGKVLTEYLEGQVALSDEQIALSLGIEVEKLAQARAAYGCFSPMSLEQLSLKTGKQLSDKQAEETDPYDLVDFVNCLATACQDLDGSERQILRMRFVEERTQQEIAQELGISQAQVSRYLSRVIIKLRAAMIGDIGNENG